LFENVESNIIMKKLRLAMLVAVCTSISSVSFGQMGGSTIGGGNSINPTTSSQFGSFSGTSGMTTPTASSNLFGGFGGMGAQNFGGLGTGQMGRNVGTGLGMGMGLGMANMGMGGMGLGGMGMGGMGMGMGGMGMGGLGMGGMGGMNRGMGGMGGNQNGRNNRQVRHSLRVGFDYVGLTNTDRAANINTKLTKITLPPRLKGANVDVALEGRTAVLRGTVKNADAAKMIERLVLLEPGVDAVRSELVFGEVGPEAVTGQEVR
jgi:hypothetical protein